MKTILTFAITFVLIKTAAYAQADSSMVHIKLTDGSSSIGKIVEKDSLQIVIITTTGVRTEIPWSSIESAEMVTIGPDGEYSHTDPNTSRLFFLPTGRTIPGGGGYLSDDELVLTSVGVGVTDFLTLWGGISLIPVSSDQLFYLSAKARLVHIESIDLSVGYLYCSVPGLDHGGNLNVPYASMTYGSDRSSLTVAFGNTFGSSGMGILVIGGETQVSKSSALLSENWITLNGNGVVFSFGLRIFGDLLSADFGLIVPVSITALGDFPIVPWVGFAYNWGTGKTLSN